MLTMMTLLMVLTIMTLLMMLTMMALVKVLTMMALVMILKMMTMVMTGMMLVKRWWWWYYTEVGQAPPGDWMVSWRGWCWGALWPRNAFGPKPSDLLSSSKTVAQAETARRIHIYQLSIISQKQIHTVSQPPENKQIMIQLLSVMLWTPLYMTIQTQQGRV